MYNYFMLIGVVEGYYYGQTFTIKLRVDRMFGQGADHFEINIVDEPMVEFAKKVIEPNKKITIKGRIVQLENKLELIGERIITM